MVDDFQDLDEAEGEWSGRAFWPAFGRRRLRRQSEPDLVATEGDGGKIGVQLDY